VVSDGTFEITLPSGEMWPVADFERHFTAPPAGTAAEDLAALLARARALRGATMLDDDFSIMRLDL
jgi:serine phosphatase RsbU (regulator of sigma subunit)